MKPWIWIAIIVAALIIIVVGLIAGTLYWAKKPDADFVWKFVKDNPDKSSITLLRDGKLVAQANSDRVMPLASAVKTMVAIEYAKQAAAGIVKPEERVLLAELEKYYLPNLDGGAHPAWLEHIKQAGSAKDEAVALQEVAKGMILFSSNANTDYLMDKLGLDNINSTVNELGLKRHEPLDWLVAPLLVPYELMQGYPELLIKEAKEKAKAEMKAMTPDKFKAVTGDIQKKLKADADGSYKRAANITSWYDPEFDRFFSDRMTGATTQEYASVMAKLNGRSHFTPDVYEHLKPVMEGLMQNPANQEWLEHAGRKGGSTSYVLTEAIYATDKHGARTELALFFNDLGTMESMKLTASLNEFELKLLKDEAFRNKVIAGIGQQ